ncbi:MAG: class I SAM-dependent methyltransferase, partial [Parafilimonas terrae]|nr:class I SAM-dependent methyltransferase [Parafilimonas terrae]
LDLGCGIGRFAAALAPRVAGVIGLDVSPAMVSAARRTCASFGNVEIRQGDGLGLGEIAGGSLDLVLAVDSFPYLVQAGGTLAADHVASAARALVPGGTLAILNYSYRGDPARDREDLARLAARSGLALRPRETLGLQHWDAEAFLLDRT